jgi:hypothetical protein
MNRGEVYRFSYLWNHEAKRGEESGRKIRRVVLMMEMGGSLYLFPMSGDRPQPREDGKERLFVIVPEIERRRIGLGHDTEKVTHLILDHYNKVRRDRLYDFESIHPVGSFSLKFLDQVAKLFREAVHEKRPIVGLKRI